MLASLLVSVPLAKAEVNDIDLVPLRALVPYREVLRLNISMKVVMGVHVFYSAELIR
jgi:hypothetical protein